MEHLELIKNEIDNRLDEEQIIKILGNSHWVKEEEEDQFYIFCKIQLIDPNHIAIFPQMLTRLYNMQEHFKFRELIKQFEQNFSSFKILKEFNTHIDEKTFKSILHLQDQMTTYKNLTFAQRYFTSITACNIHNENTSSCESRQNKSHFSSAQIIFMQQNRISIQECLDMTQIINAAYGLEHEMLGFGRLVLEGFSFYQYCRMYKFKQVGEKWIRVLKNYNSDQIPAQDMKHPDDRVLKRVYNKAIYTERQNQFHQDQMDLGHICDLLSYIEDGKCHIDTDRSDEILQSLVVVDSDDFDLSSYYGYSYMNQSQSLQNVIDFQPKEEHKHQFDQTISLSLNSFDLEQNQESRQIDPYEQESVIEDDEIIIQDTSTLYLLTKINESQQKLILSLTEESRTIVVSTNLAHQIQTSNNLSKSNQKIPVNQQSHQQVDQDFNLGQPFKDQNSVLQFDQVLIQQENQMIERTQNMNPTEVPHQQDFTLRDHDEGPNAIRDLDDELIFTNDHILATNPFIQFVSDQPIQEFEMMFENDYMHTQIILINSLLTIENQNSLILNKNILRKLFVLSETSNLIREHLKHLLRFLTANLSTYDDQIKNKNEVNKSKDVLLQLLNLIQINQHVSQDDQRRFHNVFQTTLLTQQEDHLSGQDSISLFAENFDPWSKLNNCLTLLCTLYSVKDFFQLVQKSQETIGSLEDMQNLTMINNVLKITQIDVQNQRRLFEFIDMNKELVQLNQVLSILNALIQIFDQKLNLFKMTFNSIDLSTFQIMEADSIQIKTTKFMKKFKRLHINHQPSDVKQKGNFNKRKMKSKQKIEQTLAQYQIQHLTDLFNGSSSQSFDETESTSLLNPWSNEKPDISYLYGSLLKTIQLTGQKQQHERMNPQFIQRFNLNELDFDLNELSTTNFKFNVMRFQLSKIMKMLFNSDNQIKNQIIQFYFNMFSLVRFNFTYDLNKETRLMHLQALLQIQSLTSRLVQCQVQDYQSLNINSKDLNLLSDVDFVINLPQSHDIPSVSLQFKDQLGIELSFKQRLLQTSNGTKNMSKCLERKVVRKLKMI